MLPQEVLQKVQFLNKYSRYDWDINKRETWEETINRVMSYLKKTAGKALDKSTAKRIENALLSQRISPSMRLMATAGKGADRNQISIYNCSYLPLESSVDFRDLTMLLGHGTGVGFSVEDVYVSKWASVPQAYIATYRFVVPDDIEGWALSIKMLIDNALDGFDTVFDYRLVRPKGTPLKTRGGYASGPEPLMAAHDAIRNILSSRKGKRLRSLDLFDIANHVADAIVSGGVRRSAMIAIFDKDDELMLQCKSGEWWKDNIQRSRSNISLVIDDEWSLEQWRNYIRLMDANKSGEPGIWSRYGIRNSLPARRLYVEGMGPNPCFLKGTQIQTVHGAMNIEDITEPTMVYSMDKDGKLVIKQSTASWKTKENAETIRIKVSSGSELIVTPEHKIFVVGKGWVMAKDIVVGDVVAHFKRNRRGVRYAGVRLSTQKESEEVMEHRFVWNGVYGSLPDSLDVHHIDNNGYNNDVDNLMAMPHTEHSSLTRYSVPNDHQIFDDNGRFAKGNGGYTKQIIAIPEDIEVKLGFYGKAAGPYVVSVEPGPTGDVYDLNVEDTHCMIANNIVAHNCVEQILRPRQFCNLDQVIVRSDDTKEDIFENIRLAAIVGTIQSAMTNFHGIDERFAEASNEERLLGVSIAGLMDNPLLNTGDEALLSELKNAVIETNKLWAKRLGINPSTSVTCIKPDGNTSVLYDTSPGMHGRYAKYYIRRIELQWGEPVANWAIEQGIPFALKFGQSWENPKTIVLEFPVKAPDGAAIQRERSAIEQLETWLSYKVAYTETNPSVTIMYRPDELDDIAVWLHDNQSEVVGLSFLPADDHTYQQAPYEEITEAEYNNLANAFPAVDLDAFWQYESNRDTTETLQTLACAGGACLIG